MVLGALASGCGFNAMIAGIVNDDDFSVRDQNPTAKTQRAENTLVVISEESDTHLRLVTLTVPTEALEFNGLVELGEEAQARPFVRVAEGEKTEMIRSDGVRVINTLTPEFAEGGEGYLDVQRDGDEVYGTFEVDLLDGGYLDGSFALTLD